jgi:hypothetical protein
MKRPLIGAKGFRSFHWTRGNKLKEGHGGLWKGGLLVYEKEKKKGGEGSVKKSFFSSYVWRGAHGKGVCKD